MSVGLDAALADIKVEPIQDEMSVPDDSGSVAPSTPPPAEAGAEGATVGENKDQTSQGDSTVQPPQGGEQQKTDEQVLAELQAAAQPQEGDSAVIRNLRELIKTRVDKLEAAAAPDQSQPVLSDQDRESLDLVQGLFDYDLEQNRPTTKKFIDGVSNKDPQLVQQILTDAIQVPMPNAQIPGWTYGHELLQSMGLDPMKFQDLVRFSRGEISGDAFGIETVPEFIPAEYHEAYKQINPVIRTDVDIYLRSEDPAQKAAAMQILQDKRATIESTRVNLERTQRDTQAFESQVTQEVVTQVEQTYDGLLTAIGTNRAFNEVKVSADTGVDGFVKNTIVNQIAALGDENSVVARRAAQSFEAMGVKVDTAKISSLLESIQKDTEIAVRADREAKARGVNVSAQAQEARARVSRAVGEATSMANRIASEALAKYSPSGIATTQQNSNDPIIRGDAGGGSQKGPGTNGVMSPADLDALIRGTTKSLQEQAAG